MVFECFRDQVQNSSGEVTEGHFVAIRPSGGSIRAADPIHSIILGAARVSSKDA